jgi:hypothetical protein
LTLIDQVTTAIAIPLGSVMLYYALKWHRDAQRIKREAHLE